MNRIEICTVLFRLIRAFDFCKNKICHIVNFSGKKKKAPRMHSNEAIFVIAYSGNIQFMLITRLRRFLNNKMVLNNLPRTTIYIYIYIFKERERVVFGG